MPISKCPVLVSVAVAVIVAVSAVEAQDHAQHYVLDGLGGVHAGGGAPAIAPGAPYFGFDVAASIEYVAVGMGATTGDGLLVLDKFGGVHPAGALAAAPPGGPTPYFGFDIARDLTLRDVPPRVAGSFSAGSQIVGTNYAVLVSATVHAPDDGFLLVTSTSGVDCTGPSTALFSVTLNGTTPPPNLEMRQSQGCDGRTVALSHVFTVAAGSHTVNAIGRAIEPTGEAVFTNKTITVVFIDRDGNGAS